MEETVSGGPSENAGGSGTLDWAVVGGGIAGLYAAWRLAGAGQRSVAVFEEANLVGGRLLSVPVPGTNTHAELGAMRFAEKHLFLRGLVGELNRGGHHLTETEFVMPNKRLFLRGQWLDGTLLNCDGCGRPSGIPYRLNPDEIKVIKAGIDRGGSAAHVPVWLVEHAIKLAFREITGVGANPMNPEDITSEQWAAIRKTAQLRGVALHKVGFWNLLQAFLSPEAVLLARDAFGYESIVCNWNAGEAIRWFLDDFTTGYLTLEEGMQGLAIQLGRSLENLVPNAVHPLHRLVGLTKDKRGFRLSFVDPNDATPVVSHRIARRVILALPKFPLQQLHLDDLLTHEMRVRWRTLLSQVTGHELFKLILAYDEPWWTPPYARDLVVADLPVRQTYFHAPAPNRREALVLASYNDGHYADFWRPVVARTDARDVHFTRNFGHLSPEHKRLLGWLGISTRLALKAHSQLELFHGKKAAPPFTGLAMDWVSPNNMDGWHTWNVPGEPWNTMKEVRQPFRDLELYVCGEAFSPEQGWIEGALRSVEGLMHKLSVAPPRWVPQARFDDRKYSGYEEYVDA